VSGWKRCEKHLIRMQLTPGDFDVAKQFSRCTGKQAGARRLWGSKRVIMGSKRLQRRFRMTKLREEMQSDAKGL